MKALNKIRTTLKTDQLEQETAQVAPPALKTHIVKVKPQPRKHKVVNYGAKVLVDEEVPDAYVFMYLPDPDQAEELHRGCVPANFSSGVPVDDQMIYFHTREGATGPEFQVIYTKEDHEGGEPFFNMILPWTEDVDALWIEALQQLEDGGHVSEDALNFLDGDPLWIFGIADPATQRAIEKTGVVPMLRCMGQRPCLEEWFAYLNADEQGDSDYRWVVESFAEVELPPPWTSFKGVGSVVCYLNNETNETTWKHPFYDYFAQLLNHCRSSTHEEHIKLRINRLLWSYEAESQTDLSTQMPLVSPKYVKTLGDILGCDLVEEPYMVRTLKTFLKAFSQMYHEGELDTQEVKWCLEIVENERAKQAVAKQLPYETDPTEQLDTGAGQVYCIECGDGACLYCPECADCFCQPCFERLHAKGNRATHEPNYFIPCSICKTNPAKLTCTYTRNKYCTDCYQRKHAKTLPKFLELKPLKIDYKRSAKQDRGEPFVDPKSFGKHTKITIAPFDEVLDPEIKETYSKPAPLNTTLGDKWHAFYDLRGVKYYYNFETQESMRRPQDDLIKPIAALDASAMKSRKEVVGQMAMSKSPRLMPEWHEGVEKGGRDDEN